MSITFIPISTSNNCFNEEVVSKKWTQFIQQLSESLSESLETDINKNDLESIINTSLEKHYSLQNISTVIKKEEPIKHKVDNVTSEAKTVAKRGRKKKSETETKTTSKEVKKCMQILKNNNQCKSNAINGLNYCSRHSQKEKPKVKSDSSSDEITSDEESE